MSARRMALLAAGSFVVAADATLVAGLLPQIAKALSVSVAATGQAVTVYAAGYALGAPALVRVARRARPAGLLAWSLGVFAVANAATGAAPSLVALLAARLAAGICAGVFMACAAAAAGASAPPRRRGRALALVVGGASLATAFGVPLGTLASAIAGWRAVFFAVAAVAALAAVAARLSPAAAPARPPPPARAAAPRGRLVAILTVTLLWATGSFTFFTYIGAVLRQTASVSTAGLAGVLLVFGTAGLAGTAASGWLTDRRGPLLALCGSLALTALALAGMGLTAAVPGHSALAASIAAIAGYGLGTWATTPPQQHRLLGSGGDARLLLSVNASALYLGVALGGAAGGIILAVSHSVSAVCWAAAGLELAALAVAAGSNRATERARRGAA